VNEKHPQSNPVLSRLSLRVPAGFNFWRTVLSHGWCSLPPFAYNADARQLDRVLRLSDESVVHCRLRGNGQTVAVVVASKTPLAKHHRKDIAQQLAICLRLDEDFSPFHAEARRRPKHRWISTSCSGRLLRSPSVFEDAVKMICTTNCTWSLTTLMVSNLVQNYGQRFDDTLCAFPTPQAIAATTEKHLRTVCKTGYRAPYILELGERVAAGRLDIESWRDSTLATDELFKQLREVKGIGPYAAGNILKLLGRYDYLGLDSWVRAKYYELHRRGRKVKDAAIEKHYAPYGKWRGLFFWLEMTKYWHDEKFEL
jgi:N-glycosylase/DNA lyase